MSRPKARYACAMVVELDDGRSATGAPRAADRAPLLALLTHAFHDDPLFVHWFAPRVREARIAVLMHGLVVKHDAVARITLAREAGVLVGAMLHTAPGASLPEDPGLAPSWQHQLLLWLLGYSRTFAEESHQASRLYRAHEVPEPHWTVMILAVAAAHRGRGIGAQLLARAIADSEASGHVLHLHTRDPRNLSLYLRAGFVERSSFALPHAVMGRSLVRSASRSIAAPTV